MRQTSFWILVITFPNICVCNIGNLFLNFLEPDSLANKPFVPCEENIFKHFNTLNGTGSKAYLTFESQIQLCPNFCDNATTIHDFCLTHEPDYVQAFSATVQSDRCCDARRCQCVCHFHCHTFRTKEMEFRNEGFRHCVWAEDKSDLFRKSKLVCQRQRDHLACEQAHERFLCPRQYVCIGETCLACVNPNCVSRRDKKITKFLIASQQTTS